MNSLNFGHKIRPQHLARRAVVYLRQSSDKQVRHNKESQHLQYGLRDRVRELGWKQIEILDIDLGHSASLGAAQREGFDRLVASVARREVGIVMSREISRLVRSDKDWCQLMEVCQVFDTLIGDAEQVYDLSLIDDQLVLGIKGTMSVAEIHLLKMRMLQGMREKARRGEFARQLPPGYKRDEGKVVKDPDQRVQKAVALVFSKFTQTRSVRQTFTWLHEEGIELPVNKYINGRLQIVWRLPSHALVNDMLHNPFYAGAYVFGRRPVETVLKEGRVFRRQRGHAMDPEQCSVFLAGHHEGYISWESYRENRLTMRHNAHYGRGDEAVGSIRSGQGLLVGLLRCGQCGRRLHVRYWGKSGTSARYLCKGTYDGGGKKYCLGFGGRAVDERIGQELLRVLSPLGMQASLAAIAKLSSTEDERCVALRLQLEQLEYEAQRAFEQYNEVDARNRLVASELERRWNVKLEQVQTARSALQELEKKTRPLLEHQRTAILALGERFDDVWSSTHCPVELKKTIVRTVIEEIVANLEDHARTLHLIIHWKGGAHTELRMGKPVSAVGLGTTIEDLEIIRKMATRYGDNEIAYVLNKLGRRTGKGKRWNEERVATARRNHAINGQKRTKPDPEILTMNGAAEYLGVCSATLRKLVSSGVVTKQQIVPWAPWEIRRIDLDAPPVRAIVERLRRTGKLIVEGVGSKYQMNLLE